MKGWELFEASFSISRPALTPLLAFFTYKKRGKQPNCFPLRYPSNRFPFIRKYT